MWKHVQRSAVAVYDRARAGAMPSIRPRRFLARDRSRRRCLTWAKHRSSLELKEPVPVGLYVARLPVGRRHASSAQVFEDKGGRRLGVVLPRVDARRTVTYTLEGPANGRGRSEAGISFETHDAQPQGQARSPAPDRVSRRNRQQAVFLPPDRAHRRAVHAGLPDADPSRTRIMTIPTSGRAGSRSAKSTASTSGPRESGSAPFKRPDESWSSPVLSSAA